MKINYRLEIVLSGMLLTGTTQKYVANKLGKDTRTARRCGYDTIVRKTFNIERGLEGPIAKKAVQDPHSKISWKTTQVNAIYCQQITRTRTPVSKDTVRRYLTQDLGVRPYKRPKQPKNFSKTESKQVKFLYGKAKLDCG